MVKKVIKFEEDVVSVFYDDPDTKREIISMAYTYLINETEDNIPAGLANCIASKPDGLR
jgi:hypothetical protein